MKEQVFVFDTSLMSKFQDLPGCSVSTADIFHLKHECINNGNFTDRAATETNEDQKQVIPYIIVRRKNKVLAYKRSKKSGEGRLHDKWSVGVGGHINPVDYVSPKYGVNLLLSRAIGRELTEELDWGDQEDCTINGLQDYAVLYDDADAVGRVHIGYVWTVDVPENSEWPKPKEDTIAACQWVTLKEALALPNLEGWSKIILETMANEGK